MNKLIMSLMLGFGLMQAGAAEWLTGKDFSKALEQAKSEDKRILIDFTGSDW